MNKTYLLIFLVVCSSILVPLAFAADTIPGTKPNIVVIMTDDQDVASLSHLPKIQHLLVHKGTTFKNFMVTCSLCCPSRAVFLTGQYAHNNGVEGNLLPLGGYTKLDHANTLPVWLQKSGYYTGHIGKYLNGYGTISTALTSSDNIPVVVTNTKDAILQASNDFPAGVKTNDAILAMTVIPPGYSEWYGSIDPTTYKYYNYTLNENGVLVTYGFTPKDYQTDVYTKIANDFISRRASAPDGKPFFLVIAPVAAHNVDGTPDYPEPALRYKGYFQNEPHPMPKGFNEPDMSDKPAFFRNLPRFNGQQNDTMLHRYQARLETLLAVDDMVEGVVMTLQETGQLDNTIIIFTSDNGWLQGEHRIPQGKALAYEPSIRVPLIMRGPNIPEGKVVTNLVANIDLAPTIAEFGRATPLRVMDGLSLTPLLNGKAIAKRNGFHIMFKADPNLWFGHYLDFDAIRTDRYKYVKYTNGAEELYDLQLDPYETQNVAKLPNASSVKSMLSTRLNVLKTCSGNTCK